MSSFIMRDDDGMPVYITDSCALQDQDREFLRSVGVADTAGPGRLIRLYWHVSDPLLHAVAVVMMAALSLLSRFVPEDPMARK